MVGMCVWRFQANSKKKINKIKFKNKEKICKALFNRTLIMQVLEDF